MTITVRELRDDELEGVAGGLFGVPFMVGVVVGTWVAVGAGAVAAELSQGQNLWEKVEAYANSQH
jgi:hypothetical protein